MQKYEKERKALEHKIRVARAIEPADLILENARVVNVFSGDIHESNVAIADEIIVGIGEYRGHRMIDLQGAYQLDRVAFADRDSRLTAHVGRLRILAVPSARWSLAAFVQYSSAADRAIANLRLRYNPREGTDFYVVYDEGFNTDRQRLVPELPVSGDRTVMVKLYSTLAR